MEPTSTVFTASVTCTVGGAELSSRQQRIKEKLLILTNFNLKITMM